MKHFPLGLVVCLCLAAWRGYPAEGVSADICVYGGTSGGVIAAVQAARMGKQVVLLEPGRHLGGLTSGGLGATDIGNKAAIGGLSRQFYRRLGRHYGQAEAWKFEPHVAEMVYGQILREKNVPVFLGARLASVRKEGARIQEIETEGGGRRFRARLFIDATYEGDLMAQAGVSYFVGRESNARYNETLNGVRAKTPFHQFVVPVDPYRVSGNPSSGLLPFIQSEGPGVPGEGDRSVQAYNFRLCFTTNATNRLPVAPPANYDPADYELLARYLEALVAAGKHPELRQFWNPIWMPNGKTDINNNGGFSTDFIGANYDYPDGDYATRQRIWQAHEDYTRGFITFLATSPRVPENMRADMRRWGPCKDEFPDTGGWPNQLYIREARRMISSYVMTEHNCRGEAKAEDPVGLGAYGMDSHNCRRIVRDGHVENEGDVQVHGFSPYPISYRSIVPKAGECENLLVPICLSASHIAYGSIRMEPVFMILGQSAATAGALALDEDCTVQKVEYSALRKLLLQDGQILEWTGPTGGAAGQATAPLIKPESLPGIVLDDSAGIETGTWVASTAAPARRVGTGYIHDGNGHKGETSIRYTPDLPEAGRYEIRLISPPHANRASNVPVTISVPGGETKTVRVDQRDPAHDGFASLGVFELGKGKSCSVTLSNAGTDGYVVADGVQFLKRD